MNKRCAKIEKCKSVNRCLACYGLPDCFVSENPTDKKLKKIYTDIKAITGTEKYTLSDIKEIFAIGYEIYKNKSKFISEISEKISTGKEVKNAEANS